MLTGRLNGTIDKVCVPCIISYCIKVTQSITYVHICMKVISRNQAYVTYVFNNSIHEEHYT